MLLFRLSSLSGSALRLWLGFGGTATRSRETPPFKWYVFPEKRKERLVVVYAATNLANEFGEPRWYYAVDTELLIQQRRRILHRQRWMQHPHPKLGSSG